MKSTFKLIRRFVKVLLLSFIGLMLLNIALFIFVVSRSESSSGGWKAAELLGNELTETESGAYTLSEKGREILQQRNAWAILVEDETGDVVWHSDNLPGAFRSTTRRRTSPTTHAGISTITPRRPPPAGTTSFLWATPKTCIGSICGRPLTTS